MKYSPRHAPPMTRLLALAVAGIALCASQQALAAGTASNTPIDNTASLSFTVGGVPQTDVPSNTTTFVVDNKINLTVVTTNGAAVPATPGQVAATPLPVPPAYLSFTVTNTGNTTQDYFLSNTNPAAGATIPFGGTSEFAVSSCRTFVESSATTDGLQIGTDLEVAYLDNVVPDASKTVYLVCNIPLTATNGQDAAVGLIAQAVAADGSSGSPSPAYTNAELTAANTLAGVEIVAADGIGTEADVARDTKHSARSAYVIASATLSVTKGVTLLCDPFNGVASQKNIPGAMVQWTLTVSNTGSVPALLSTITDTLNTNTTQDPNLVVPTNAATCSSTAGTPASATGRGFRIVSSVGGRPLGGASSTGFMTGAADADGATLAGQLVTITFAEALPAGGTYVAGELKAGETATVTFNVTIN